MVSNKKRAVNWSAKAKEQLNIALINVRWSNQIPYRTWKTNIQIALTYAWPKELTLSPRQSFGRSSTADLRTYGQPCFRNFLTHTNSDTRNNFIIWKDCRPHLLSHCLPPGLSSPPWAGLLPLSTPLSNVNVYRDQNPWQRTNTVYKTGLRYTRLFLRGFTSEERNHALDNFIILMPLKKFSVSPAEPTLRIKHLYAKNMSRKTLSGYNGTHLARNLSKHPLEAVFDL